MAASADRGGKHNERDEDHDPQRRPRRCRGHRHDPRSRRTRRDGRGLLRPGADRRLGATARFVPAARAAQLAPLLHRSSPRSADRESDPGSAPMRIVYLADRPEAVAVLAEWFAAEWGDLDPLNTVEGYKARLPQRAHRERLPVCILGLVDDTPVATATLKFRELEYLPDADFWLGSGTSARTCAGGDTAPPSWRQRRRWPRRGTSRPSTSTRRARRSCTAASAGRRSAERRPTVRWRRS